MSLDETRRLLRGMEKQMTPNHEAVERVARAIYEAIPHQDQRTDLDGRAVGEAFDVPWHSIVECEEDAPYLAAALAALSAMPEVWRPAREDVTVIVETAMAYGAAFEGDDPWIDARDEFVDHVLAPAPEPVWRPIETAPFRADTLGNKWVSSCLLFIPVTDGACVAVGQMDAGEWLVGPDPDYSFTGAHPYKPTHWQPLPPPPAPEPPK